MALFKTDAQLEAETSRQRSSGGFRSLATVVVVALCSAAASLPLGDLSGGLNFIVGPLVAGIVAGLLSWGPRPERAAILAVATATLTLLFMLVSVVVVIALWGL
jgi:hypothetical protein